GVPGWLVDATAKAASLFAAGAALSGAVSTPASRLAEGCLEGLASWRPLRVAVLALVFLLPGCAALFAVQQMSGQRPAPPQEGAAASPAPPQEGAAASPAPPGEH